jgi:DNA modification methylase
MKQYKHIMPVAEDDKVSTQFGRVPMSIMEFTNEKKWEIAYYPQDETTNRRSENAKYLPGLKQSEFSSAVAEFVYKYWSMKNSIVVDPFAGRATRGVIACKLGRKYYGYEISPKTFRESSEHFKRVGVKPEIYLANGCRLDLTPNEFAHLVFTCPPYWNLEKYEKVKNQLSDLKSYESFLEQIDEAISNIYRVLRPGGFVAWVVADWRDGTGFKQFSYDSIRLFKENNLIPHDTIIIKNHSPFAAFQVGKCAARRITSKTHEYLLIFRKEGELNLTGLESDDYLENQKKFFNI